MKGALIGRQPQPLPSPAKSSFMRKMFLQYPLIFKAARYSAKATHRLLKHPLHRAPAVVTMSQDAVAGGKTMRGTIFLHLVKLLHVKFMMGHRAPIIRR